MDQKEWLWRRRSSEKTIIATDKVDLSFKRINEEKLPTENGVRPDRVVRNLSRKLASVLLDSHNKDDLLAKHAEATQEDTGGLEKLQALREAEYLKKELEEARRQAVAANEKLTHAEDALEETMRLLTSLREEDQEHLVCDVVMKTSLDFEEKLMETGKRLKNLASENTLLSKALLVKEKLVRDLHARQSQAAAEFNALMARLDSTEKENAFLRYECHMLEKELEIRNEEMEYYRRSADASHRQQSESVKKITKLEADCQRLRLQMRKRFPGPAAFTKIKNEGQMMVTDQTELRIKSLNPTREMVVRDAPVSDSTDKKMNFPIEQLRDMQEQNRTLEEIMANKISEFHSSSTRWSRTISRLSKVDEREKDFSSGHKCMELSRRSPMSNELHLTTSFDVSSDDGISSSDSWANALKSEREHYEKFQTPDSKSIGVSEMSLMDDFVEMEKLAIVSVEAPAGDMYPYGLNDKEIVPAAKGNTKLEIHTKDAGADKPFDWLQIVLSAILKQHCISKRSVVELLEDIKIAFGYTSNTTTHEAEKTGISKHSRDSSTRLVGGSSNMSALKEPSSLDISVKEMNKQHSQSDLGEAICKIIELIKGINITSLAIKDSLNSYSERDQSSLASMAPPDYYVHVFQWRTCELSSVLEQFVHTCDDLLIGKTDIVRFAQDLSFSLDWIMNNSISLDDASNARDKIKQHFGWSESRNDNQAGAIVDGPLVESHPHHRSEEQSSPLHSDSSACDRNCQSPKGNTPCSLQEENNRLREELKIVEYVKNGMAASVRSVKDTSEALTLQLPESEQSVGSLQIEIKTLRESNEMTEDEIENLKLMNEDLDTQLTVAKAKLNEVIQKLSSLEVELEDKSNTCDELETTCLELQLQLESVQKKETQNYSRNQEEKSSQNVLENAAASIKLAECQETIANLGQQLKALASTKEAGLIDKVFSTTSPATSLIHNRNIIKRPSLRNQMLAENDSKAEVLKSPSIVSTEEMQKLEPNHSTNCNTPHLSTALVSAPEESLSSTQKAGHVTTGSLAVVPSKKQGGIGFLRRLLMRRKKGSSKK
ncbi:filament-like plant protein 7 [Tripterygium wilfordii]|uniref:filament-like plant protein 7 n=1 Tax=Tripterygium wilfordii TaxID=458696 RepID=UPI0018F84238|nr:filament-like plant protein 7 [Tripterygium wilfordii]XP_038707038.1 filament-like plant protein 7 [Tripterygium wilfordii]XP_038707039.1 filament-like plant protein 7 [Tripterygium wilfordii]